MKTFISKLNDRNLQRKRESGITSYVLFSVLIICIYKLFTHSESLLITTEFSKENFNKSIWLICYLFNFLFSIGGLSYLLFPTNQNFKNIKLVKPTKTESYIFLSMFLSFPISLFLIIYTFVTNPLSGFFFKFYCFLIFFLSIIGIASIYFLYSKNKKNDLVIISKPTKFENVITIFTYLFIILVCILSSMLIYNLDVNYKIEIIKICTLIYLSYAIIERILQGNTFDKYYSQLEDFEYEIILRELDDGQIRKEFQQRFSGFLIKDWILFQNNELTNRVKTFQEDIDFYNDLIQRLDIDYKNDIENKKYMSERQSYIERTELIMSLFKDNNQKQTKLLRNTINSNFYSIEDNERSRIYSLIREIESYTNLATVSKPAE